MSYFERIAAQQNYICYYCEHRMFRHTHCFGQPIPRNALTRDHVIPRVYDGLTVPDNLIAACLQCNNLRGEMYAQAFKNIMRKWFKRDPELRVRWHSISREEFCALKLQCLAIHERQLRGLAKRHVLLAYRHYDFIYRERRRLARA